MTNAFVCDAMTTWHHDLGKAQIMRRFPDARDAVAHAVN